MSLAVKYGLRDCAHQVVGHLREPYPFEGRRLVGVSQLVGQTPDAAYDIVVERSGGLVPELRRIGHVVCHALGVVACAVCGGETVGRAVGGGEEHLVAVSALQSGRLVFVVSLNYLLYSEYGVVNFKQFFGPSEVGGAVEQGGGEYVRFRVVEYAIACHHVEMRLLGRACQFQDVVEILRLVLVQVEIAVYGCRREIDLDGFHVPVVVRVVLYIYESLVPYGDFVAALADCIVRLLVLAQTFIVHPVDDAYRKRLSVVFVQKYDVLLAGFGNIHARNIVQQRHGVGPE